MTYSLSDFAYDLPEHLIAKHPPAERSGARMLVIHRASATWEDRHFVDFPNYTGPGDCLVLNNTRVRPARLLGHRLGHEGKVEIFLLRDLGENLWEALVRPGKKLAPGTRVVLSPDLQAEILERGESGEAKVRLKSSLPLEEALEAAGHVPLPPYINREDTLDDKERYQTVFAKQRGAVAAPTAGLHFTPEILAACQARGATLAELTLHVGLGTFKPLTEENLTTKTLHHEVYEVLPEASATIQAAKRRIAIGTTSVRTLETTGGAAASGETNLFIQPGYQFRSTGAMLTNFHLPESSLLMLVAAFAGYELTMQAYRHAVAQKYRFFSYGDCMLIL
jgi:S-adenosylmethionine:tRNA ribosyltransferase-isomerase